jgi:hypothetical protein
VRDDDGMTENTPRQAMVQAALDKLPLEAMRNHVLHSMLSDHVRVFLDPDTGGFKSFAGNAEPPANAGILLNAVDIPVPLRLPPVPDDLSELGDP